MTLEAGRLDRKIVLQSLSITHDPDSNEEIESWSEYSSPWAQYIPVKEMERFSSGRELATFTARFIIRYDSRVVETDRIQFEGKNWDIIGIAEIPRRQGLTITAEVKQ